MTKRFAFFFRTIFVFVLPILAFSNTLLGQFIPIGLSGDQDLRSYQLMGKVDSSVSLSVRPYSIRHKQQQNQILFSYADSVITYGKPKLSLNKIGRLTLLPIEIIQQYNTHHPYGWNDGAMIAAKGYQSLLRGGFYASVGPLEIQAQPEFLYSVNPDFERNINYGNKLHTTYQKILFGQSSISLSAGALSVGVSTQNLWWGPGQFSSLLMSNNATGFMHAYFRTNKPLKTGVGSFEWQLIGGKLLADDNLGYENFNLKEEVGFPKEWRYLNALVITYQPKWVKGLFLGFTRALQRYNSELTLGNNGNFVNKYLPILVLPFQKANVSNDDQNNTDQLASFFVRWVQLKAKAEIYLEYGFNDYGVNVRDYIMAPTHSAAYIVGAKKIFMLPKNDTRLEMNFEITQMTQSPDFLVRDAGNWYTHVPIVQGYTNNNQIMGAGAGLGCNVQTVLGTWVKGWKQLGVMFERIERDPQYHTNHWVDLSIGFLPQYKYGNMVLSGKFQFINSSNYAWEKDINRFNLHSRLSVQYLF